MISYDDPHIQDKLKANLGETLVGYLVDPQVIEIMANDNGKLWVETYKEMKCVGDISNNKILNVINTLASLESQIVNFKNPDICVNMRLYYNKTRLRFRFQGMIPPTVDAPVFCIRKPSANVIMLEEYLQRGVITQDDFEKISRLIKNKKNIIIAGGTQSGKTTLANALLAEIALQFPNDRVITIEDTPELKCEVDNLQSLRTSDNRTMCDLLRCALRMRPDRIIVGEVRGEEALSLIKAWNTGHSGGLSTIHANSCETVIMRLKQLIEESGSIACEEAIKEAVDAVIYIQKVNGDQSSRKVTSILEYAHHQ